MSKQRQRASATAPETRRVAIYTRKSTTMGLDQEFNSLDSQRESCLAYVQRQPGWKLVDERYDDGGFTGANIDRPAFTRLMADVEASKVDVIVVYKVDRLSRSLLDFVKVMERLGAASASFVSVTQNFSTADAMGRLTMNMLMSFAEFEREMISDRTRDKIAGARRKGKWTGGPVPYGYSVKDRKLLVNELEARVVREAFDLFLMHRQRAKVAQLLNERKLLPRGGTRTKHLAWSNEAVSRILKSPIYAGFMMYGDELHPGEHPPLIEESTYRAAQAIIAGTSRVVRWTGTNPDYVLRSLVRCGLCGTMMCPGSTTKASTGKTHRYYRCSTRDKYGTGTCAAKPLPAAAIEEFVVTRISNAIAVGSLAERVAAHLETLTAGKGEDFGTLRAELATRIAESASTASKLTDEVVRLDGRARELVEQKLGVEADRLAASERQLRDLERDAAELELARKDHAWFVAALRDFAKVWVNMSPDNRGRFLRALIDKVVVNEDKGTCRVELIDVGAAVGHEEGSVSDRETSQEGARNDTPSDYRVIEEPIFWLRTRSVAFTSAPPPDKPEPIRRPAKVAQQLALAHSLQAALERGLVADQAALARTLGLTRARITQLFDLLMLAADLQEQVLALEAVDGAEPMAERTLRAVVAARTWPQQRAAWGRLRAVAERPRLGEENPA